MEGMIPADYRKAALKDLPTEWQAILTDVYLGFERRRPQGCMLQGPNGVGKSHAACALANDLYLGGLVQRRAVFMGAAEIAPLWNEWDHFRECSFHQSLKAARLLIIDDLGKEDRTTQKSSDTSVHRIGTILRSRAQNKLPTIITTNFDEEEELTITYGPSLVSLLHGVGFWLELSGPDRRKQR